MEAWRRSRGLLQLYGQEVILGLVQGSSSEMVRIVVRTHFERGTNRMCLVGLVNGLNVRCKRKRSQEKLDVFFSVRTWLNGISSY